MIIFFIGLMVFDYTGALEVCSLSATDTASQLVVSALEGAAKADCEMLEPCPQYEVQDGEEVDFVIVGGGSAGSVLANRLSEISDWTVLLLEAGGYPTRTSEIPAFFPYVQNSALDWQYKTEPSEKYCLGFKNNSCSWAQGKVLGGSSTLNHMMYVRGNRRDYDGWEDKDGAEGWSYKDVLPYFIKSEDMRASEVLATADFQNYHATGGYQTVESWENNEVETLTKSFAEGMSEVGYEQNPDCNGVTQKGFVTLQGTLRDGRRCSTKKAFLDSVYNRPNLKISTDSLASKIIIEDYETRGVEFINKNNVTITVKARKEVIVSAGAINSPQLLMLSGIGPKKHLESLGIRVIKELPVGQHLQDHPLYHLPVVTLNYSKPTDTNANNMYDFLMKRKPSRFSSLGLVTKAAFVLDEDDFPDSSQLEMFFLDFNANDTGLTSWLDCFGFRNSIHKQFQDINKRGYTVLPLASLLRPYSHGFVELRSKDPKEYPRIFPNYFDDSRDLETMLSAYEFQSRLVKSTAFKKLNAQLHELDLSGCGKYKMSSEEYRKCSIRHISSTTYHYCSTCKMGPENSDSVVDLGLRVKGIQGLRLCDSSVMPRQVSGNINAAVVMIAEKAADIIKQDWNK